jgi:hypothetical protein
MRRRLICTLAAVLILGVACAEQDPESDPFGDFLEGFDGDAPCSELFAIRNQLDPKSPSIDRINKMLRRIGCYSSTSRRTDT